MQDTGQLTFWSGEAPASPSPSRETEKGLQASPASCSSIYEQFESSCRPAGGGRRATSSGRTCRGRLVPSAELHSGSYSRSWTNSGTVWHGEYSMRSTSEYPTGRLLDSSGRLRNAAGASSLSEFLEARTPPKYSLSAKACSGIIRRAEKRGKPLPKILRDALEFVVVQGSSTTKEAQRGGVGYEPGTSPTLTADYHQPAIVEPIPIVADTTPKFGEEGDPALTLRSRENGGGINDAVALQSDGSTSRNSHGGGYCSDGSAYTLNCIDRQSVAYESGWV